jgi:hypothetical protein
VRGSVLDLRYPVVVQVSGAQLACEDTTRALGVDVDRGDGKGERRLKLGIISWRIIASWRARSWLRLWRRGRGTVSATRSRNFGPV